MEIKERQVLTEDELVLSCEAKRINTAQTIINELALKHKAVIDLGAGTCNLSFMARDAGLDVTALDARTTRAGDWWAAGGKFIHGNFLEEVPPDNIDLVFMCGILYHLTIKEQEKLLDLYRGKVTVVDTHYCREHEHSIQRDGYTGDVYSEGKSWGAMLAEPKSSVTTLASFWHAEASLMKLFARTFSTVTKIVPAYHEGILGGQLINNARTFFICIP